MPLRQWGTAALVYCIAFAFGACAASTRIEYIPDIQVRGAQSVSQLVDGVTAPPIVTERYSLELQLENDRIGLRLTNRSDGFLKIVWDDAVFVDFTGQSHGVVHTGVRLIERDKSQVPTSIAPRSFVNDAIVPKPNIVFSTSGWKFSDILPRSDEERIALKGKTFKIILPIESPQGIGPDEFEFRIVDVKKVEKHVPGFSENIERIFQKTKGTPK
jgi:hypothetical protein